jgi:hypothetical protein
MIKAIPIKKARKLLKGREENLQLDVSRYIQTVYPNVIFTSESSGVRLNMGQAKKLKAMRSENCKLPDLIILEPRGQYHGLLLELKRDGEKIFTADGKPYAGHIYEQWKTLNRLTEKQFFATFVVGFDQAKQIIDNYMNLQKY